MLKVGFFNLVSFFHFLAHASKLPDILNNLDLVTGISKDLPSFMSSANLRGHVGNELSRVPDYQRHREYQKYTNAKSTFSAR